MFPREDIHVFRAEVAAQPRGWRPEILSVLTDEERARHARFLREEDAAMFALCRGMLRFVLARGLGAAPQALAFENGPFGKPRLADARHAHVRFNVSHSGGVVLVALAVEREIGVDIEAVRPIDDLAELARSTFSMSEWRAIASAPDETSAFFATWARKEAVVKAVGLGLSLPLDAFDVEPSPAAPAALLASRDAALTASDWLMHELPPMRGYASALAAETAPRSRIVLEDWTLAAARGIAARDGAG